MTKSFCKLAIVIAVVVWFNSTTSPHLEYASTTTKNIFSMIRPAKSICILCQGLLGQIHGCRGAFGGVCFTAAQTGQLFTRASKSWSSRFHQTWLLARAFILELPRCSRYKSERIFRFRLWGMITLPPQTKHPCSTDNSASLL